MNANVYSVKLGNKVIVFLRMHTGRIYDITDCQPITDNEFGINLNGVLAVAKQVKPEYVADLLTKGASIFFKKKARRRAASKSRRIVIKKEGVYIQ